MTKHKKHLCNQKVSFPGIIQSTKAENSLKESLHIHLNIKDLRFRTGRYDVIQCFLSDGSEAESKVAEKLY